MFGFAVDQDFLHSNALVLRKSQSYQLVAVGNVLHYREYKHGLYNFCQITTNQCVI